MRFFRRKRAGRNPKKATKKSLRMPKKSASLSRKVSMLAKNVLHLKKYDETKSLQYYVNNVQLTSYTIGNDVSYGANSMYKIPLSFNSLTLPLSQGTTAATRIGNRVEIVSAKIRMMFWASPYTADVNGGQSAAIVKGWILTDRTTSYQEPQSNLLGFFQSGSTSVDPTGNNMDLFMRINTDRYKPYGRGIQLKVGNSTYPTTATGGNGSAANNFQSNNDFKLSHRKTIDFTRYLIKNQKFNDASTQPQNRGLWLLLEAVNPINQAFLTNTKPVAFSYEIEIKYKDT